MTLRPHTPKDSDAIVRLFSSVFADSEGQAEGALVGRLAQDLFDQTDGQDFFNFVADDDGEIIGSIFFSRLDFGIDIEAFLLAPVAVGTAHQRQGVGQALIHYGLSELKSRNVRIALTYGDPGFYQKVGFQPISHEVIIPPFPLSQPEGWLGQSLADDSIETLSGHCTCVKALQNPTYW